MGFLMTSYITTFKRDIRVISNRGVILAYHVTVPKTLVDTEVLSTEKFYNITMKDLSKNEPLDDVSFIKKISTKGRTFILVLPKKKIEDDEIVDLTRKYSFGFSIIPMLQQSSQGGFVISKRDYNNVLNSKRG
jgi:hypothetical protein